MNAFEFKSQLNISKFKKAQNELWDYTLTINDETFFFVNLKNYHNAGWSLISEDGQEFYNYADTRKECLADLLTSMYIDYKINLTK
jgi:hypothetical protein